MKKKKNSAANGFYTVRITDVSTALTGFGLLRTAGYESKVTHRIHFCCVMASG